MSAGTPQQKKAPAVPPDPAAPRRPDPAAERRVQVAAAKLRVALDERLGRPTPSRIKTLAKGNFQA